MITKRLQECNTGNYFGCTKTFSLKIAHRRSTKITAHLEHKSYIIKGFIIIIITAFMYYFYWRWANFIKLYTYLYDFSSFRTQNNWYILLIFIIYNSYFAFNVIDHSYILLKQWIPIYISHSYTYICKTMKSQTKTTSFTFFVLFYFLDTF